MKHINNNTLATGAPLDGLDPLRNRIDDLAYRVATSPNVTPAEKARAIELDGTAWDMTAGEHEARATIALLTALAHSVERRPATTRSTRSRASHTSRPGHRRRVASRAGDSGDDGLDGEPPPPALHPEARA